MTQHAPPLDVAGAAAYLATTERHVRYLVAHTRIPYTKIGRQLRFRIADLDAWLESNAVPATPDVRPPASEHEVALDALESMVEQYLWAPGTDEYHHAFMSAGEYACAVLATQRPDRWALTRTGLRRLDQEARP